MGGSCLQGVVPHRDSTAMGIKETENVLKEEEDNDKKKELKDEKRDGSKEDLIEVTKQGKGEANVFLRVKERLSKRSKKKKKEVIPIDFNEDTLNENLKEKKVKKEHKSDEKQTSPTADAELEEKGETSQKQQEKEDN